MLDRSGLKKYAIWSPPVSPGIRLVFPRYSGIPPVSRGMSKVFPRYPLCIRLVSVSPWYPPVSPGIPLASPGMPPVSPWARRLPIALDLRCPLMRYFTNPVFRKTECSFFWVGTPEDPRRILQRTPKMTPQDPPGDPAGENLHFQNFTWNRP